MGYQSAYSINIAQGLGLEGEQSETLTRFQDQHNKYFLFSVSSSKNERKRKMREPCIPPSYVKEQGTPEELAKLMNNKTLQLHEQEKHQEYRTVSHNSQK